MFKKNCLPFTITNNKDLNELIIRTISGLVMALGLISIYYYSAMIYENILLTGLAVISGYEIDKLIPNTKHRFMLLPFYPILPILALLFLHISYRNTNLLFPLTPFIISSIADTGGYFVGKLWGHHKMCPSISPGKSWEGFAGGWTGVTLFLYTGTPFFDHTPLCWIGKSTIIQITLIGLLLTTVAFLGGFFISYLKRRKGVKDSGSFIPGHGGFLDRCDSTFFVAPLIWLLTLFFR